MGLFSSSNRSSNTTNNNTDNSSINLNAGGTAIDGDGNVVNITDGGAFNLVGSAFDDLNESLADNFENLVEGQIKGLGDITDLQKTTAEINADTFNNIVDQQSNFTGRALDYSEIQAQRGIEAAMQANDAIAETAQKVSAGDAGLISESMNKIVMGATVVAALFAISRMVN
ncbi:hypothetical protein HF888_07795 [Bermanella marisrubri]|uniref:Methyl-accepting chemotaxis protein n=1 Tax=Bermanella marisrubri TaxID=207949 RepID=Q1N4P7_9GAMM|nr:hypothetical protein [Bermanella marisrubri]EAT13381.1 hypothetical protein RED65_01435 [Oceanobacter sp. RED65] [Bermanella marisrubri]QIZ84135.1 hypothetical protein HF888_07795 [Bermanella marisrubri]